MKEITLTPYQAISGRQFEEPVKIVIKRSQLSQTTFQDGKFTFSFTDCDFKQLVIENDEEIDFKNISISFAYCYIKDVQVTNVTTKNLSIHFGSSILAGKIAECPLTDVSFNNCILDRHFFLLNLPKVSLSLTEENIFPKKWKVLFSRLSITDAFEILTQEQSYYIYDCIKTSVSSSWDENAEKGFYLRWYDQNPQMRLGYKFSSQQQQKLNINLSMKYALPTQDVEASLTNLSLRSLSFSGTPKGKISLEDVQITQWHITEFQPKGEVSFYNIYPQPNQKQDSKIAFHKSNLDNVSINALDFSEYGLVSFYRTKFSKTVFTSCSFPGNAISFDKFTSLANIHYKDKKLQSFYKDRYEVYLQLKMALEATGNFHEAQKLYAIANDALRKIEDVSAWDKFILWVNRHSNNHGLSIRRPVILFVASTIFLYIFYLYSLGRIFNSNEIDYDLIGYYFSFIDLTHRNNFLVEKDEFNSFSLTIDYATKVLVSFFIYQFIAAFRKYGRK
jgi:hypothetical protein